MSSGEGRNAFQNYEWDEEKNIPVVANPYNCIVGCSSCRNKCPVEAIEFPPLTMLKKF